MPTSDLLLLLPREGQVDSAFVRSQAEAGASVVAALPASSALDADRLVAYEFPHSVDLASVEGLRLRDVVLVRAGQDHADHLVMLFIWNSDRSHFDIDAVRVPWGRVEGKRDKRNNPLGKNPTNFWDFEEERRVLREEAGELFGTPSAGGPAADVPGLGLDLEAIGRLVLGHSAPGGTVHLWADDAAWSAIRAVVESEGRTAIRIPGGPSDPAPVLEVPCSPQGEVGRLDTEPLTWSWKGATARAWIGDCRAGLAGLQPGTVTHVVTSPPYNIGYSPFNVARPNKHGELVAPSREAYKDDLDAEDYNGLIASTFQAIDRVASPEHLDVFFNVKSSYKDARCVPPFYLLALMPDRWQVLDLLIWRYDISYDPARGKYKPTYEWVMRLGYGDVPRAKRPMNSWYLPILKGNSVERRSLSHPAIFPRELVEKALCESAAQRGASFVVDPFLGSGTTLSACLAKGVDCAGFELSRAFEEDIRLRMKAYGTGGEDGGDRAGALGVSGGAPPPPGAAGTPLFDKLRRG